MSIYSRSSRVTTFEEQQQTPLFSAGNGKQGPRGRFGSLKGQSTDGRWQAPDRVPFSRGSFPETRLPPSLSLSISLDNIFEKSWRNCIYYTVHIEDVEKKKRQCEYGSVLRGSIRAPPLNRERRRRGIEYMYMYIYI